MHKIVPALESDNLSDAVLCIWYQEMKKGQGPLAEDPGPTPGAAPKSTKYVPPSLREGANKRGESMQSNRRGKQGSFCLYAQPMRNGVTL